MSDSDASPRLEPESHAKRDNRVAGASLEAPFPFTNMHRNGYRNPLRKTC